MRTRPISLAPGPSTQNVALDGTGTFCLVLDVSIGGHDAEEYYDLCSADARYSCRMARSQAEFTGERFELNFTGLHEGTTYSLTMGLGLEMELPLFVDVPFEELTDHGATTDAPAESSEVDEEDIEPVEPRSTQDEVAHLEEEEEVEELDGAAQEMEVDG